MAQRVPLKAQSEEDDAFEGREGEHHIAQGLWEALVLVDLQHTAKEELVGVRDPPEQGEG